MPFAGEGRKIAEVPSKALKIEKAFFLYKVTHRSTLVFVLVHHVFKGEILPIILLILRINRFVLNIN
jgi:hypothetical protein